MQNRSRSRMTPPETPFGGSYRNGRSCPRIHRSLEYWSSLIFTREGPSKISSVIMPLWLQAGFNHRRPVSSQWRILSIKGFGILGSVHQQTKARLAVPCMASRTRPVILQTWSHLRHPKCAFILSLWEEKYYPTSRLPLLNDRLFQIVCLYHTGACWALKLILKKLDSWFVRPKHAA